MRCRHRDFGSSECFAAVKVQSANFPRPPSEVKGEHHEAPPPPAKWRLIFAVNLLAALAMPVGMAAQYNPSQDHKAKHQKYKLIDMGTLAGPQGYINPLGNGGPYINGPGAVVGAAETTVALNPNSNPYPCFPGPNVNHALRWQNGHSIDLGALPPADENCSGANAVAINDRGDIAFQSENGIIDPLLGVTEIRAVLSKDGKLNDLGTLGLRPYRDVPLKILPE
jgi:hypothetical protein